jgi:hypothetical protein
MDLLKALLKKRRRGCFFQREEIKDKNFNTIYKEPRRMFAAFFIKYVDKKICIARGLEMRLLNS